jgi:two-component system sensor histidine kinase DegS
VNAPALSGDQGPSGRATARGWAGWDAVRAVVRPPVEDPRFWVVQGMVALVALADHAADTYVPHGPLLSFLLVTFFFVPATFAALTFGFPGSAATVLWCVAVDAPVILLHHRGLERLAELVQLVAVGGIALFVGSRVHREAAARQHAEEAHAKYRGLFEASPLPILILGPAGSVRAMNPAARAWFGGPGPDEAARLEDLVGGPCAAALAGTALHGAEKVGSLEVRTRRGTVVWVDPSIIRIGEDLYALLLRDVTEERRRQEDLRVFTTGILRAHEEERRRLAHELHDDTIQELILLCRQLDTVERVCGTLPGEAATALGEARASAERLVRSLREFAHALRPSILDDLGLVASLRQLVQETGRRAGLRGRVHVVGIPRRLPAPVELGLFRIAQEAVRNVERHAQASRVVVRLSFARDEVRLDVTDDGRGFTVPTDGDLAARRHLGLIGVRERAQLLGGTVDVRSAPGRGTTLSARIPVVEDQEDASRGGRRSTGAAPGEREPPGPSQEVEHGHDPGPDGAGVGARGGAHPAGGHGPHPGPG